MGFLIPNISTYGGDIDRLIYIVTLIVIPAFTIAVSIVVYILIKYHRERHGKAEYDSGELSSRGLAKRIITIDVVVILLDLVIVWISVGIWKDFAIEIPEEDSLMNVQVVARQFSWSFNYAGLDGQLNTEDDIYDTYKLRVPVGQKVVLHLTSTDVVHSFWVKHLRLKQDTVPGRTIRRWFEVSEERVNELGADWGEEVVVEKIFELEKKIRELRQRLRKEGDEGKRVELRVSIEKEKGLLREEHRVNQLGKRLFEIACAEMCGDSGLGEGHFNMNGWLIVESLDSFNDWVQDESAYLRDWVGMRVVSLSNFLTRVLNPDEHNRFLSK